MRLVKTRLSKVRLLNVDRLTGDYRGYSPTTTFSL